MWTPLFFLFNKNVYDEGGAGSEGEGTGGAGQ